MYRVKTQNHYIACTDIGFSTFCNHLLESVFRAEFVTKWDNINEGHIEIGMFGANLRTFWSYLKLCSTLDTFLDGF
jgi:hypothetical protein